MTALFAAVLSELGASIRTFATVEACVTWYARQRSARNGRALQLGPGSSPRSVADRNETEATYLRIARCLTVRHGADEDGEPLGFARDELAARREAERRVELLAAFYLGGTERLTNRLQDLGYGGRKQCESYVLYAERVLRRRFRAEGLLRG